MSDEVVKLEGEWTIHGAAALKETLLAHLQQGNHAYDMQGVTEMDSAGVQLLLALQRGLARQGKPLELGPLSPAVSQVLQTYGLDHDLRGLEELPELQEGTA